MLPLGIGRRRQTEVPEVEAERPEWFQQLVPRYVAFKGKINDTDCSNREKMEPFIIVARDPENDPVSSREQRRNRGEAQAARGDLTPGKRIRKTPLLEWKKQIFDLMADGTARTFNRISIELVDLAADTTWGSNMEWALWELVSEGLIEHTGKIPLYFRKVQ